MDSAAGSAVTLLTSRIEVLEKQSGQRYRAVKLFRTFAYGSAAVSVLLIGAFIFLTVQFYTVTNYLDEARARRDARDAVQEYVACSLLSESEQSDPRVTQAETLLSCSIVLSGPPPTPSGGPSPNPTPSTKAP